MLRASAEAASEASALLSFRSVATYRTEDRKVPRSRRLSARLAAALCSLAGDLFLALLLLGLRAPQGLLRGLLRLRERLHLEDGPRRRGRDQALLHRHHFHLRTRRRARMRGRPGCPAE